MAIPRLHIDTTAVLVVDIQEKLLPHIDRGDAVAEQAGRLVDGARALGLPVIVTEQYRKGLGLTVPSLADRLAPETPRFEKLVFSACIDPVRQELGRQGSKAVIVCGIEAHVCVLQSCLDLAASGYLAAVATDAIGSRSASDRDAAVLRLVQAGVVPTTVESALFELVHEAGGERFKAVLPAVK